MSRIKVSFWLLCIGFTAMWVVAEPLARGMHPFSQLQFPLINFTGILAMAVMSVALVLALRSVSVEPYVGGLDKSYRLHKWLGVAALVAVLAHWLLIKAPSWLIALGLMSRPAREAARRPPANTGLLHALQGPAKSVGEWCFYAAVLLIVLALLKRFPYRWFLRTHRLLAIVFLVLVFHSALLLKTAYWTHVVAYALSALMLAGIAAALYILLRRVGRTRQAVGEIDEVASHSDGSILRVGVCLKDRWPGHDAGQFAFVSFDDDEGPHPFTISSTWKNDGRLMFLIKGLGDYTRALPSALAKGSLVAIEGPYGRFNFSGSHARQIWVSAGIGITPFISRMQELAAHPDGKTIDLFHATADRNSAEVDRLGALAFSARVRLHVWVAAENGWLTGERIREALPEWRDADVWFCGPVDFGTQLRKDLVGAGLPAGAFHQELFHLR